MSFAKVAGHPDYTSSGTMFIPELWAGELLVKFYKVTCLDKITNNKYEGVIRNMGDTVHIRTAPDTDIYDYEKGQKLQVQRPESTAVDLLIDKGKYYNMLCDDVDKVQSDLNLLSDWATDAAEQMKAKVEYTVFSDIYNDMSAYNTGATAGLETAGFNLGATGAPVQFTKANAIDYIVDCGTVLDEQNVPENGRWMVLPAWACGMIMKSDIKDASLTGDSSSIIRGDGRLGRIGNFEIYSSNNLYSVAAASEASGFKSFWALFGTNDAITFASQYVKTETLRSESTFGDIVRGLKVFGYKVVKPEALGGLYIRK